MDMIIKYIDGGRALNKIVGFIINGMIIVHIAEKRENKN
jgi:hypothetical protein